MVSRKASICAVAFVAGLAAIEVSAQVPIPQQPQGASPVAGDATVGFQPTIDIFIENPLQPIFHGTTNLPDGAELILSLSRPDSGYMAQDKVTVADGHFTTSQFSQSGHPMNPGLYSIEASMSIAELQPGSVQAVIGHNGERMSGRLINKGVLGGNVLDFKIERQLGGASDAVLDAAARAQNMADLEQWKAKSCVYSVDFANSAVRAGIMTGPEIVGAERQRRIDACMSR